MAVCILRVKSGLNFSNSILIDEMQLDIMVNRKTSYLSEEPFLHSRSQSMSTVSKYQISIISFYNNIIIYKGIYLLYITISTL